MLPGICIFVALVGCTFIHGISNNHHAKAVAPEDAIITSLAASCNPTPQDDALRNIRNTIIEEPKKPHRVSMKYRIASNEVVFAEKTVYYREYRKAPKRLCLVNRDIDENTTYETFEYVYHSPDKNKLTCIHKHPDQPRKISKMRVDDDLNLIDNPIQSV